MSQAVPQTISNGRENAASRAVREPQRVRSDTLLRGERRLIIEHEGASYVLLLTRNDKLILTK